MKSVEALVKHYRETIAMIPAEIRELVNRSGGLSESTLLDLILNPQDQGVDSPCPPPQNYVRTGCDVEACLEMGNSKLASGSVAYCIMAGGAGTRIGEPKALLRLPDIGLSLLTIKLFQAIGNGPIWIVVSPSMKQQLVDHVNSQIGIDHARIKYIEQFESYRLHPNNDVVFVDGKPDLYPCGHGDLFPALTKSKILHEFRDAGGEFVSVVNVDNVLAGLDPVLVGWHTLSQSNVTCEVVRREPGDSGGLVCTDRGQTQIVETYRMRGVYNSDEFEWLNTNSIIFNANLNIEPLGNSWNRVQKNINGRLVIQHERLLQEITEAYDTMFVAVNREDRFFPIKNVSDLNLASQRLNANKFL
jgi:UDP-N-acetylglucosamine pyrophosphorylase